MNSTHLRNALLGIAAVASILSCVAAALSGAILAAALAGATVFGIVGWMAMELRSVSPIRQAVIEKAVQQVEAGRRLAIYERETGLLAHWYITLRCEEECHRAERYDRPLTLIVIEPEATAEAWKAQGQLADWLGRKLRPADMAAYFGNGRFVVAMPEIGRAGALALLARLHQDIAGVETGLASFPQDGRDFEALSRVALKNLGVASETAA